MKFTFKFLLANGKTERHAFTAFCLGLARASADAYAKLAFAKGELLDYYAEL